MPRVERGIPSDVLELLRILERAGYRAWLVGGCVRDLLLGREPSDYDVTTTARPGDVIRVFESRGWRVVPKGVEYGVVSVVHPATRREIEVATLRRDVRYDERSRRRVAVEFTVSIEEDAQRRDFTINALYMDPRGEVYDPTGHGLRDLRSRVIRFVGEPAQRIREDPLRALRAIRFAAALGFTVEPRSLEAVTRERWRLRLVSRERIGEEILKAAKGSITTFVHLLYETGVYEHVLPLMRAWPPVHHDHRGHHHGESLYEHVLEALARLDAAGAPPEAKLAAWLHDAGKPLTMRVHGDKVTFHGHESIGARIAYGVVKYSWRLGDRLARLVAEAVRLHHAVRDVYAAAGGARRAAARIAARYGEAGVLAAVVAYGDTGDPAMLEVARLAREMLARPRPLVDGRTIMRVFGVPPGPEVGRIKRLLYQVQLEIGASSAEEVLVEACRRYRLCPEARRRVEAEPA